MKKNHYKFPFDCDKFCPYYRSWDLSIDDWTNACEKLHMQIDDCDAYGPAKLQSICPLSEYKRRYYKLVYKIKSLFKKGR
jgi:hypothetical protein